ncbi:MAG: adenylosuccinate lyase [bacterium]
MSIDPLLAVSAVDGRYRSKTEPLAMMTSEYGLMRYRVEVECRWFMFLGQHPAIAELPELSAQDKAFVLAIIDNFDLQDAHAIKDFESTTNHDVKAVEYFVKAKLGSNENLLPYVEWIHFGCTSEDINNVAYALMVQQAREQVLVPQMMKLVNTLDGLAVEHAELGMLSRTHGQSASPTTLGKEFKNVAVRLLRQTQHCQQTSILAKFNGAVGNFNAHLSAYPDCDWAALSAEFVTSLGLTNNPWTTQIEPHDYLAELFHTLTRFNQVLLDFNRDMWSYIAIEYFTQQKVEGETGSSTMPHKINPIDFENSEGNLGLGNALLEHMANKLPVSRWQRDLSDSTVLRNIGSAFAHCLIAYQATLKGLSRLQVNHAAIRRDLADSWEVLAEPVQTVMRKYGLREPYEQLKSATRGQQIDEAVYLELIETLDLPAAAREELRALTPLAYLGLAAQLARQPLPL